MTKPAVTLRNSKGSSLTFTELDTNFSNLRDSTISLTADTGGTQVTVDLNGNITLVAGSNITITGDNTGKTVTITGAAGLTNPLTADMDTNGYWIKDGVDTNVVIDEQTLTIQDPADRLEAWLDINVSRGANICRLSTGDDLDLILNSSSQVKDSAGNKTGGTRSILALDKDGDNISLTMSDTADGYVFISPGVVHLLGMTTTVRNARTTVQDGMIIYNTTDGKFQGRAGGVWVDLH